MQTKLGAFCDRIIEAGWLMAAILTPLYFNVYTNRVFEPDKISLVRSIALLMAAAWLVKTVDAAMGRQPARPAGDGANQSPLQSIIQRNILTIPILFLVAAYIISTLGSIAPMITLWGSYQRLQGTYSTFSYIVIAVLMMATMTRREQVERLVTVIILTSLPTAMYGIVEHLKLEFLPWGGDVTARVTSTMGNPIFISAYLLMTIPLALARVLDRLQRLLATAANGGNGQSSDGGNRSTRITLVAVAVVQGLAWYLLIHYGLAIYGNILLRQPSSTLDLAILLVAGALAVALPLTVRRGIALLLSTSFYVAATLVSLAGFWYAQSRGPELGLLAGLIIFVFLYAMKRNSKAIWYGGLAAATVVVVVIGLVQLPNTPLEFLRPSLGRVATLVDEGSSIVRSLIWQGARQLIGQHPPIGLAGVYSDSLNAVRPLIGYGPEAMYVAYNSFYPPDLAHHEARNASPDRSHNDTLDALVMTGIIGYFAYWVVFYTVIYAGLSFLGLIDKRHGRQLYVALLLCGLIALVMIYANVLPIQLIPGPPLLGIVTLGLYLLVAAFFLYDWKGVMSSVDLLLIALVSAVAGHFVEIQFGFGVAATNVHFWLYAALVVVAGRLLQQQAQEPAPVKAAAVVAPAVPERVLAAAPAAAARPVIATAGVQKKKSKTVAAGKQRQEQRSVARPPVQPRSGEQGPWALIKQVAPGILPLALAAGVILTTMAYDLILPKGNTTEPKATTSIQFWLYFFTWLACAFVVTFDRPQQPGSDEVNERIASLIVYTSISLVMWILYVVLRNLVDTTGASSAEQVPVALVSMFYLVIFTYGVGLAVGLYLERRPATPLKWAGSAGPVIYAAAAVVAIFLAVVTNANIVVADVYYKTGLAYDNAGRYDGSIQTYQRAIQLEPSQDFYYLFLGRAYMELARQFPERTANPIFDPNVESPLALSRERLSTLGRQDLIKSSLTVLLDARRLNPLNTDHTANLARLYTFWGEVTGDAAKDAQADTYYREATTLSPNNAQLWTEWACIYGRFCLYWTDSPSLAQEFAHAEEKLAQAISLDDRYDVAYSYLGNLNVSMGEKLQPQNLDYFVKAADAYSNCLKLVPGQADCAMSRGYVYSRYLNRASDAIADFQTTLKSLPTADQALKMTDSAQKQQAVAGLTRVYQNMALTYAQLGQYDQAVSAIQIASQLNPTDQQLKALLEQYKQQQKK